MPKPTKGPRLGGSSSHQKAMLANGQRPTANGQRPTADPTPAGQRSHSDKGYTVQPPKTNRYEHRRFRCGDVRGAGRLARRRANAARHRGRISLSVDGHHRNT